MNSKRCVHGLCPITLIAIIIAFCSTSNAVEPLYRDPSWPIEKRIDDLLGRMTLKEKVGQMNQTGTRRGLDPQLIKGTALEIGPVGGFFGALYSLNSTRSRVHAETVNRYQSIAIDQTRLGIPLLITEEGTHGVRDPGATIFPEGLAMASTWNIDLVRQVYAAVAEEARAMGIHQLCTLVVEPNRDPRLGRNQEGFSEDPYMCARIARAIVEGVQGDDIGANDKAVAVLCHFPGQSEPVSGMEQGAMEIFERMLREVFLPPWRAGIKAGALAVMATYPAIDGIPAHSSPYLLETVLRNELGFEGIVVGEGGGIATLLRERIVDTDAAAARLAVNAGVDTTIWLEPAYQKPLIENVRQGRVAVGTIDRSVRRILQTKFMLGLFERPYVNVDRAERIVHSKAHQELALEAARQGVILLKNKDKLLPLDKNIKSIAVIGPNADNSRNQLGDYIAKTIPQHIVTVLDGIKSKVSLGTKVTYVKGCEIIVDDVNEIEKARIAAENADVAILVVGERARKDATGKWTGTNGEGKDVASLDLTGIQQQLVEAVCRTGTATIVVLINGRPLSVRWTAEHAGAIVEPWICGEMGGLAVAEVIFGDYNPTGRLPITVPRHAGQLPAYYNHKPTKMLKMKKGYVDISATPLYEFGFGLSYTTFEYSNLSVTPKSPAERFGPAAEILVTFDVRNTGPRKGDEVLQLYINDILSSVTTAVKELKAFERVTLDPGQTKTIEFTITPDQLSLLDRNLNRIVEPGTFEVMIGASSQDIRLKTTFEIKD